MKNKSYGFSLIELMVVLVIIAILVVIAYPSYQGYVQKTRRATAKQALMETAQELERCYSELLAYNDANCNVTFPFNAPTDGTTQYYTISSPTLTASTFTITATTIGSQLSDTDCTTLSLDQKGQKTAENSDCW